MCPRPARMDDTLRDALMVKVRNLFSQMEIFQERWAALPGFQGILIVIDAQALIGGQDLIRGDFARGAEVCRLASLVLLFFSPCHNSPFI